MKEPFAPYASALDMLLYESSSLKDLASLSGRDIFQFYRGANLRNLDLSGQDLTGLNFDFADLDGTRLENVRVDVGALNKASVDEEYKSLVDPFDLGIEDLFIPEIGALSLNYRMRPSTLESLIGSRGMYIRDLAKASNLTAASFWRMRNGYFVTFSTIIKFISFIRGESHMFIHSEEDEHVLRQPCIQARMPSEGEVEAERILRAADTIRHSWRLNPTPLHHEHNARKIHVFSVDLIDDDIWF